MIIMGGVFSQAGAIRRFVEAVEGGDAVSIRPYAPGRAVEAFDVEIPLTNYGACCGYSREVMVSEAVYWETRPGEENVLSAANVAAWGIDITTPLF